MNSFFQSIMDNVKGKQSEIFQQAFREELTAFIFSNPTLDELVVALSEAKAKGLLQDHRLDEFLALDKSNPGQAPTKRLPRLSNNDKQIGMELIASVLLHQEEAVPKTQIIKLCDSELVDMKWSSIVGALRKCGYVTDNGEQRQKKAYLLTEEGRVFAQGLMEDPPSDTSQKQAA